MSQLDDDELQELFAVCSSVEFKILMISFSGWTRFHYHGPSEISIEILVMEVNKEKLSSVF
jgi:hypothetical protein